MALETVLFYVFAAATVGASLLVIGQRNPVYSVMLLIGSFGGLSGLYVLLDAPFAAVMQIIIYAGAIMVLFLFVVMLLNVGKEEAAAQASESPLNPPGARRLGAALAVAFLVEAAWAVWHVTTRQTGALADVPAGEVSSVNQIGRVLFTDYALPFEVTSILILVALVGAIVLARPEPR